jgi:hypothetical protein
VARAKETGPVSDVTAGYDDTDEALNALEQTLATLDDAQQARVLLYRQGANGTRDKFLKQMTPLEWRSYDLAGVLADYGGGNFRVRVYNEDTKLIRNVGFEIEEPRGGAKPRLDIIPASVPQQSNADILAGIAQLATTMQSAMLTGFKELATALAPKQENRQDFLNELTVMKTLFAPANGGRNEFGNLDALMKMFEFVSEKIPRTGESSGADVFRDLIKEFAPVIAQAAQRVSAQPAPFPPAQVRPITAAPVGAAAPTPVYRNDAAPGPFQNNAAPVAEPISKEEEEMTLRLKLAVGMMLKKAEQREPAEDFADSVLDWIPEGMYESLASTPTPEVIGHLAAIDARVMTHSEWFAVLHSAIKERLTEEPEEGTTPIPGASESTS